MARRTQQECQDVRDRVRLTVARNATSTEDRRTLFLMLGLTYADDAEAIAYMQRAKPTPLPLASDPSFAHHQ